jgi:hypothetical protein
MKPGIHATADRLPLDWSVQPRVLRFAPTSEAADNNRRGSPAALIGAWLVVALIPLLWGRVVSLALDEPLLGIVAGMLALIPVMIGLCPRSTSGSRERVRGHRA